MIGKHFLRWLALDYYKRNFGGLDRCFCFGRLIPHDLSFDPGKPIFEV